MRGAETTTKTVEQKDTQGREGVTTRKGKGREGRGTELQRERDRDRQTDTQTERQPES